MVLACSEGHAPPPRSPPPLSTVLSGSLEGLGRARRAGLHHTASMAPVTEIIAGAGGPSASVGGA